MAWGDGQCLAPLNHALPSVPAQPQGASADPVLSEEGKLKNLIFKRSHLYERKKTEKGEKNNQHRIKLGVIAKISRSNI